MNKEGISRVWLIAAVTLLLGVTMQWSWTGTLRKVQTQRPPNSGDGGLQLPQVQSFLSSHSSQIDVANDF